MSEVDWSGRGCCTSTVEVGVRVWENREVGGEHQGLGLQ